MSIRDDVALMEQYRTLNESQRALKLGQSVELLHLADYPSYRLAMELLLGARERRVPLYRSIWRRTADAARSAWREWCRRETIIPVKPV